MSSCCSVKPSAETLTACPQCGQTGVRVDPITPKALLTIQAFRKGVPEVPRFCSNAECPVVYFDASVPVTFREDELLVPVHEKRPHNPDVPVCYCFGHTPGSIEAEVERTGRSTASRTISAEVKAGNCACEVRNPKGSCCLGGVTKVERRALELANVR